MVEMKARSVAHGVDNVASHPDAAASDPVDPTEKSTLAKETPILSE
jgi:hypothetical protein